MEWLDFTTVTEIVGLLSSLTAVWQFISSFKKNYIPETLLLLTRPKKGSQAFNLEVA